MAQAAIAHAQFETIHPFVDGNGRTGRALIHLILRRRGLAVRAGGAVPAAGVTHPRDVGRRNRAFEAPEAIAAFTALERQLASPDGNTRISAPARVVPRRT